MDNFQLWYDAADTATDTITDFTAGVGGDNLSIPINLLTNYTPGINPFVSGHVKLTQSGADTLVEVDLDGPGGPGAFQTMVILKNVTKGTLVASNLSGLDPSITPGDDFINGTAGGDFIDALAGNDTINGLVGNDTLSGGLGDDVLDGGEGDDYLSGNDGNDNITGGLGNDSVEGGDGNDTLERPGGHRHPCRRTG